MLNVYTMHEQQV